MRNVEKLRDYRADTAIVLGSGLGSLVGKPTGEQIVSYKNFADIPEPAVPGHAGQFVVGEIGNARIIFAQGRVHLYEGRSAHEATSIIRILAEAGIKRLILTNAAGSLNPNFKPGSWMMITDHINLTGTSPLVENASPARTVVAAGVSAGAPAPRFLDLSEAYSVRWREEFGNAAKKSGTLLHEGVYAAMIGPQYETPAEVRMLQKLGADAVGMSTVLETIQARALGLEVAGFSCLTNLAAGLTSLTVTHQEVLETGKEAANDFVRLLKAALA